MAKTSSSLKKLIFFSLVLRLLLLLISGWHPDILNHVDWGTRFLNLGPEKFYENIFWGVSWPNQPLGTMLLFALMAIIKNGLLNFFLFLNNSFSFFPSFIIPILESNLHFWLVKLPFILADIFLGYLIYHIVNQFFPKKATLATSLFLLNPVVIYNSTIWGQTDSLINLLAIAGIYLTFQKKYFWGIILFLSGFLFKLSLIIYLPIFGLILIKRLIDWKKFLFPFIFFLIILFLIAIPFKLDGFSSFQWLWYMYTNRVLPRQGSMLNGNAFNFWFLIFGPDFSRSEFTPFLGISYQLWGRLALISCFIPIWIKFFRSKLTLSNIFFTLLLTSFASFILLTNMHERYLYPVLPIFSVLIFFIPKFFTLKKYLIISIIHLINMYNLWFYPLIPFLKSFLIFSNFFICRCLSLILIISCGYYLINYLKSDH